MLKHFVWWFCAKFERQMRRCCKLRMWTVIMLFLYRTL